MQYIRELTEVQRRKISNMLNFFSVTHYPFTVRHSVYTPADVSTTRFEQTQQLHRHDYFQLWYCARGSYIHRIDDVDYACREGSLIIVPPASYHAYSCPEDAETELYCLEGTYFFFRRFSEPLYTTIIANLFCHHFSKEAHIEPKFFIQLEGDTRKTADKLFKRLRQWNWKNEIPNFSNIERQIAELFSLPCFALSEGRQKYAAAFIKNKLNPLMDSVLYLNKNFRKKIHREELLKISTLCQTDFSRYFKRLTGLSYALYLQQLRIHKAHNMISFSHYSFDYIANQCGFCDKMYMSTLYKKYYGTTMRSSRFRRKDLIREFPNMIMTREHWDRINID